jgi:hypothetical protein
VDRLFEIAVKSRRRMETLARRRRASKDLHCLCAVAALDLFRSFREAQIEVRYAVGKKHCFCLVGDFMVDTTATQFKNAEPVEGVWIASSRDPDFLDDPGVWEVSTSFPTEEEVLAADLWRHWPSNQRPHALDTRRSRR